MSRPLLAVATLFFFAGCSNAPLRAKPHDCLQSREWVELQREENVDLLQKRAPRWTQRASWSVVEGTKTHLFAVGSAAGIAKRDLSRAEAEARARGVFANAFGTSSTVVAPVPGGRTRSTFATTSGPAPVVINHYRDPAQKTEYALVCLSR
jgi:hypothetical protein